MNERIKRMREKATNTPIQLGISKMKIAIDSLNESRNLSHIRQRAHLAADYLNKMPIFIPDDDLIMGTGSTYYNGSELEFEMGVWSEAELDGCFAANPGMYWISDEDRAEFVRLQPAMAAAATNKRTSDYMAAIEWDNPRMRSFLKAGVVLPAWKDRNSGSTNAIAQTGMSPGPGFCLKSLDWDELLAHGAKGVLDRAHACLDGLRITTREDFEHWEYWTALVEEFEAWANFGHRCAAVAREYAAKETNPQRKAELEEMARICDKVPENGATTFREAVQLFWFGWLMVESNTMSAGRIDQHLYPYYKHDIEAGLITDDEVLELIEMIKLKCTTWHTVRGALGRGRHSGDSRWMNFVIGGCDAEGNDISNELTYMFIQAAKEINTPHFTITLRVNKNTPAKLMEAGIDCVRTGVGMPAFVSDDSYINFLTDLGFSQEDASDYAICGCLDVVIPGRSRTCGVKFFNQPMVLEIMLNNGYDKFSQEQIGPETGDPREFKTFDELMAAYDKQQDYFMELAAERANIDDLINARLIADPFASAFMRDGVECGEELQSRKIEPFDIASTIMTIGGINTANSLTAIKKLVFDDKKYTMDQLLTALDADWKGYEQMQEDFKNAPKYGNNDDYADETVEYVYKKFSESVKSTPCHEGNCSIPSGISISSHQPAGKSVGATPDGRNAYTILSDGMMSPEQGTDTQGPLAAFNSARKVNQDSFSATLYNMKFNPDALKTDDDVAKLASVVKTYLTNGGKQIQFNVVRQEDLLDAQVKPEQHKDLIVRVAGYSAYFTQLTPMMQDEIIDRTSEEAVK